VNRKHILFDSSHPQMTYEELVDQCGVAATISEA
jgi:hypothetical protein